jgi:hypothetical protein
VRDFRDAQAEPVTALAEEMTRFLATICAA